MDDVVAAGGDWPPDVLILDPVELIETAEPPTGAEVDHDEEDDALILRDEDSEDSQDEGAQ